MKEIKIPELGPKIFDSYYDYEVQAWVENGKYVRCGHPESMDCKCYGKENAGKDAIQWKL